MSTMTADPFSPRPDGKSAPLITGARAASAPRSPKVMPRGANCGASQPQPAAAAVAANVTNCCQRRNVQAVHTGEDAAVAAL